MTVLILGLLLFLLPHSVPMFAPRWRESVVARIGLMPWKGVYSILSLLGLVLIIIGFGMARSTPTLAWVPAYGLRPVTSLCTLLAFILIVAAYVPNNHAKAWLGHPMLAGVVLWALGHLLVTGFVHDLVLFIPLLIWAVADFVASRQRDQRTGIAWPRGTLIGDTVSVLAGVATWAVFALWLHRWWIGMAPFA